MTAIEGDSPVGERERTLGSYIPSTTRGRRARGKQAGLPAKAKYYPATDSELVP